MRLSKVNRTIAIVEPRSREKLRGRRLRERCARALTHSILVRSAGLLAEIWYSDTSPQNTSLFVSKPICREAGISLANQIRSAAMLTESVYY
jgi:hypothetical protein